MADKIATRAAYGEFLVEKGAVRRDLVVMDADLSGSTKTKGFAQAYPERFINCGIAEQDLMAEAAGIALSGHVVCASTFAMFATCRAYEIIRNSIGYTHANVKVCATHAGITVGEDTAWSIFIHALRGVPVSWCLGVGVYWSIKTIDVFPTIAQFLSYILFGIIVFTLTRVASRTISAGALLTDRDVSISTLPTGALPQSPLTSTEQAVGSRAAISLEKGTVLTASMTSGSLAQQLGDDERLVQVAIDVGAELARPGARVDIIGQAPEGWRPPEQNETPQGGTTQNPGEQSESPTAPKDPGNSSTTSPTGSPDAPSSPTDQESPGFQESSLSISQGIPAGPFGTHSTVLCSGARVVMIQQVGEGGQWTGNKKVTLITLAIPASSATLVVGAATNSTLGIALSP